ncbi:hypothetical protein B0H14DRAFT_2224403, partial [Mycena olivaceomarginata]
TLDPGALCAYCDRELPITPTETLTAMGEKLFSRSWPNPMPDNPNHRTLPLITMCVEYCARHEFERNLIPAALAGNWPFNPQFSHLFHRILSLGPTLRALCKNLDQSYLFKALHRHYGNRVTQLSSLGHQYLDNRRSAHSSGYYGERGIQMCDATLRFMFPPTFDITPFHPLTYDIVIREVLVPEASIRLIQEDLNITLDAAIEVLQESHSFGCALHPSDK